MERADASTLAKHWRWEKDQDGQGHPALTTGGGELVLLPRPAPAALTLHQPIHNP